MISHREWGRRLSERIRVALAAGDLERALHLARNGDGEARSLAKEYSLMYKGLGITVRILLDLLGELGARTLASHGEPTRRALADLLGRFRHDMMTLLQHAYSEGAVRGALEDGPELSRPPSSAELERDLARAARLVTQAESLFSREQERMAEEVVRAIEERDAPRARVLLDRKERGQYVPLHDRLVRFMAEVFGYVLEQFGSAELVRFHRATADRQREGFEKWERLSPAELARATAFLVKQHMGVVDVREDDEKFILEQVPCGSGGRLRLSGVYSAQDALPFVEERGAATVGQERIPVYCSHCPIWNSVAPIEWFGRPQWVFERPARPDGSCTVYIYKRRDAIPGAYYARLGLSDAASKQLER